MILFFSFSALSYANYIQSSLSQADSLKILGVLKESFDFGDALDTYRGYKIEWGTKTPETNSYWSVAYTTSGADVGIRQQMSQPYAKLIKDAYKVTIADDAILHLEEKLDVSTLMFKYNYSGALSEDLFYNLSIGAGFNYAKSKVVGKIREDVRLQVNDEDAKLAGVIDIGLGYKLDENTSFIINYERKAGKSVNFKKSPKGKIKLDNASLEMGFRYSY